MNRYTNWPSQNLLCPTSRRNRNQNLKDFHSQCSFEFILHFNLAFVSNGQQDWTHTACVLPPCCRNRISDAGHQTRMLISLEQQDQPVHGEPLGQILPGGAFYIMTRSGSKLGTQSMGHLYFDLIHRSASSKRLDFFFFSKPHRF